MRYIKYAMLTALVASAASANMLDLGSISVSGNSTINTTQSFFVYVSQPGFLLNASQLTTATGAGRVLVSVQGYADPNFLNPRPIYEWGLNQYPANPGRIVPSGRILVEFDLYPILSLPLSTLHMVLNTDDSYNRGSVLSLTPPAPLARLTTNPEPGTWAMLLTGVGVFGLICCRRRNRVG